MWTKHYEGVTVNVYRRRSEVKVSSIYIRKLKCHETEDYFGDDSARLEIYADGSKHQLKKSINDGETWTINRSFNYSTHMVLKLYDEDNDGDDHLGTINVTNQSVNNKTGKFTRDGANYTIYYDVVYQEQTPEQLDSKTLHIDRLRCYETEDVSGADECKLVVTVDGVSHTFKRSLNNNQSWFINRDFTFANQARVKLYDEDSIDSDDNLGTLNISKTEKWNATGKFTRDGANYSLYYDVVDPDCAELNVVRKISLISLKCHETEDYNGKDELRLEVYADGVYQEKHGRNLNDNQTWYLNKNYIYQHNIQLKLFDQDSGFLDDDDLLGHVKINTRLTSNASKKFNLDGSDYTLTYKVEVGQIVINQSLNDLIDAFAASNKQGYWPKVDKVDLIADLRKIAGNPLEVKQGGAPLCGPSAVLYELARQAPERYISLCRDCYEKGYIPGRNKRYNASLKLRSSKIRNGVSPANWIMQGTLVDDSNLILDVDASDDGLASFSYPRYLEDWTKEILLYDRVEYISTMFWGEFDAMRDARRAFNDGGVAFPLIHSKIFSDGATIGYPNHWISYAGDLEIDDGSMWVHDSGHISFKAYTWGRIEPVSVSEGYFEDHFYGVVLGYR